MAKLRSKIAVILHSVFFTTLVIPLITAAPPFLFAVGHNKDFAQKDWAKALKNWFDGHDTISVGCIFWPLFMLVVLFLIKALQNWSKATDEMTRGQLNELLIAFDRIVGKKLQRYGRAAREKSKATNKKTSHTDLRSISKPEDQIRALIDALYFSFRTLLDVDNIFVVLARMGKDKFVVGFEYFLPEHEAPRTDPAALQNESCSFTQAVNAGDLIIIEDIAKELKKRRPRFVSGHNGSASGSMICYPLYHRDLLSTPYVISVKSPEAHFFKDAKKKIYKNILSRFEMRILLEYSLEVVMKTKGEQ